MTQFKYHYAFIKDRLRQIEENVIHLEEEHGEDCYELRGHIREARNTLDAIKFREDEYDYEINEEFEVEGEKLSNVRGHLREVINRGNLSEGYRNYLKHVDDVIERSWKMRDEREKKVEVVLEANRRANRETWKEKNIGVLLIAAGMTVIIDQFVMGFLPLYWAIPFLGLGIPITIYAFLQNTRKFREYAEKGIEEAEKDE